MNYIYDILLNFNETLYDFYEWNLSDNVGHIRKIPLFRIDTNTLSQIKNYDIKFEKDFLKKIENKTEKFTSRDVEKIKYAVLFSDCNDVIAVKFNDSGHNFQYSKLLVDEQEEVLDVCNRCNETELCLQTFKLKFFDKFKTRLQIEKINYLMKSLKMLEKNKEMEKLKYLYFECFNEKQNSIDIIINTLKQAVENDKYGNMMYDFFKLISIN